MTVVHPNHIVGINSITVQTGDSLSVHKSDGSLIRTIVSNTGVSTFHAIEVSKGGGDLVVGVSTFFVDNSTGRVGIGTDNPSCSLNVNGQIITYDPTDGVSSSYGLVISPTSTGGTREAIITKANSDLRIAAGSGSYQADRANILLTNSGKNVIINAATTSGGVGIGTDPAELLHIAGSSGITTARLRITDKSNGIANDTQYGVIQFEQRDTNTPGVSVEVAAVMTDTSNGATALQIKTGTPSTITERLRINSSGHVVPGADSTYDLGLTGTRFRNVYADTVYGDGSNLTGVSAGVQTAAQTATNAVVTLDLSKQDHKLTLAGICTVDCKGGTEGDAHTIRIINSGIATVGFSTYFLFPSGAAPILPSTNTAINQISFTVHHVGAGATQLLAGASLNYG